MEPVQARDSTAGHATIAGCLCRVASVACTLRMMKPTR